jgi:hypothetical protein
VIGEHRAARALEHVASLDQAGDIALLMEAVR